jgi:ribosome biogenesis protein
MANLPVVFTTQTPYPIPAQKFFIPASWKRFQLSQLINKSLALSQPIPFDFLIRGEILRVTLEEWCADKGVGQVRAQLINKSKSEDPLTTTIGGND